METAQAQRKKLAQARRVVVKVGTSTLTHPDGKLNLPQMKRLTREISALHREGREVILVSSGAVGAGVGRIGAKAGHIKSIPQKQALAAIGQGALMRLYEEFFDGFGLNVAQVLLTRQDLEDRKRYVNARNTFLWLLRWKVVPIVNENDTVAVEEIRFGDNDTLSALVAGLVDADLLVLLSDVDGLYDGDPHRGGGFRLIPLVEKITPQVESLARGTGSGLAIGGMTTKITAARIATDCGVPMVIANGQKPGVLARVVAGELVGTLFCAGTGLSGRRKWILYGNRPVGTLVVDDGAKKALVESGKSLLPSGLLEVQGEFEMGNVVRVRDRNGIEFARGITNYAAEDLDRIKGLHSRQINRVLGYDYGEEVIHRDNLVLVTDSQDLDGLEEEIVDQGTKS